MEFRNMITGQAVRPAPWQLDLKIGDYYTIAAPTAAMGDGEHFEVFDDMPPVYGEIVDDEECAPGYFLARGYSAWCPDGELGILNICEPTRRLTAEEFTAARARGWRAES